MSFYEQVITLCKEKGVSRSRMADDIGISRSTPKDWADKKSIPQFSTIKKIADYFDVPVTYFTEDQGSNIQNVHDNHGIITNASAPVTIVNGTDEHLNAQETELLNAFRQLGVMEQAQILVKTAELLRESKKS